MPRILDCPCPPQPLTCVGDATGYGIFEAETMQRVGRQASDASVNGVRDMANNVSCAGKCTLQLGALTPPTTILQEAHRLWWTLFIIVECHVQCETTMTVQCVE